MEIKHIIIHTLQTDQNKCLLSDIELEVNTTKPFKCVESKVRNVFKSDNLKGSKFNENSEVKALCLAYLEDKDFINLSKKLASKLFDIKFTNGLYSSSTLIISEVIFDERRYLVAVDSNLKSAMRLAIQDSDDNQLNALEEYSMLFSRAISAKDFVFMYDLLNDDLLTIEAPIKNDQEVYNVLTTLFLEAKSSYSYRQAMKALMDFSNEVIDEYDLDAISIKPQLKAKVYEQIDEEVNVSEVIEEVFTHPQAKMKMHHECERIDLKTVEKHSDNVNKTFQTQRFVTDLGIEIVVPLDYLNNSNVFEMEITKDELGTITIKNIANILTK